MTQVLNSISTNFPPASTSMIVGVIGNQQNDQREIELKSLIAKLPPNPVVLEVGTWFGLGSTKTFLRGLPTGASLFLCDQWEPYVSERDKSFVKHDWKHGENTYTRMDKVTHLAFLHTIKQVRNSQSKGKIEVNILKGKSRDILSNLKENSFDLIYLDGSHYYHDVKKDILESKRIVNRFRGIICGDDLEKYPSKKLVEEAESHVDEDYVNGYHPGVLLAVSEEFACVNMVNGFWWVYCIDGEFRNTI